MLQKPTLVFAFAAAVFGLVGGMRALAADKDPVWKDEGDSDDDQQEEPAPATVRSKSQDRAQAAEGERLRVASSPQVRRFHEVLDELLAEFSYDVKMGQIKGLSNLSVRKVKVSKAIPSTYEEYIETLLDERIHANSEIKLISCVPCKTRTSSLVDGKLLITSPSTNLAKLDAAAAQLGIENFMDAVLVYHTTHMVLALSIFNTHTKELVWARTYNSETVKSRYQKLAVDYSQVAKGRTSEDYEPEYRFMFGAGGASIPNVTGNSDDSSMLNAQVRATEKFNNRKSEFGLMLSFFKSMSSSVNPYPTEGGSASAASPSATTSSEPNLVPFKSATAIFATFGHVFLGAVESYNEVRQGFHIGLGAFGSTGYLAPIGRAGWDIFLGRRFSTSFALDYIGPSSILVGAEKVKTKGGAGFDAVLSLNY